MSDLKCPVLRHDLPSVPQRMRKLPLDDRGYPVPFFVQWFDDGPDFRVVDGNNFRACIKRHLCWLCGEPLGVFKAFVIGPMCAVNRISSEPPSHRDCAVFAVEACPFLVRPKAQRRTAALPDDATSAAGIHLDRNPGASAVWITRTYRIETVRSDSLRAVNGGVLIHLGDPIELLWFTAGRPATSAEAERAVSEERSRKGTEK